jgi:hypothetical protein
MSLSHSGALASLPVRALSISSQRQGGQPCNPDGVIAAHAQSATMLQRPGLHCAARVLDGQLAMRVLLDPAVPSRTPAASSGPVRSWDQSKTTTPAAVSRSFSLGQATEGGGPPCNGDDGIVVRAQSAAMHHRSGLHWAVATHLPRVGDGLGSRSSRVPVGPLDTKAVPDGGGWVATAWSSGPDRSRVQSKMDRAPSAPWMGPPCNPDGAIAVHAQSASMHHRCDLHRGARPSGPPPQSLGSTTSRGPAGPVASEALLIGGNPEGPAPSSGPHRSRDPSKMDPILALCSTSFPYGRT